MATAWVNTFLKDDLIPLAASYGLDTTGTLDEIRARMREYIREHPAEFVNPPTRTTSRRLSIATHSDHTTDIDNEPPLIRMNSPVMLTLPPGASPYVPPPSTSFTVNEERQNAHAKMLNQVRKWGCQFDGRDPVAFLERVDELREGYGYTGEQLLRGLPELLRGDALLWARNNREFWTTWEEFCADFRVQYLPPQYFEQLQREIFERRQKETERFTQYATTMVTLMRRAGGFTREQQLNRIHANMRPTYRKYVRRGEVRSLTDLIARITEIEGIEQEERAEKAEKKNSTGRPTVAAVYNRDECCWKCGQRGHTRLTCQRPPRKFCSQCGKDGVLTRDCHPPGNARRTGAQAADSGATTSN